MEGGDFYLELKLLNQYLNKNSDKKTICALANRFYFINIDLKDIH